MSNLMTSEWDYNRTSRDHSTTDHNSYMNRMVCGTFLSLMHKNNHRHHNNNGYFHKYCHLLHNIQYPGNPYHRIIAPLYIALYPDPE